MYVSAIVTLEPNTAEFINQRPDPICAAGDLGDSDPADF